MGCEKYAAIQRKSSTYNNPGENSADVAVLSVQPLLRIFIFKGDTTGFKTRLLWRSWCQRGKVVWKIYKENSD